MALPSSVRIGLLQGLWPQAPSAKSAKALGGVLQAGPGIEDRGRGLGSLGQDHYEGACLTEAVSDFQKFSRQTFRSPQKERIGEIDRVSGMRNWMPEGNSISRAGVEKPERTPRRGQSLRRHQWKEAIPCGTREGWVAEGLLRAESAEGFSALFPGGEEGEFFVS